MTDKEAMKLALEALRMAYELCKGHGVDFKEYGLKFDKDIPAKYDNAITALKEALAQPEQEPDYWLGYALQAHTEKPFENATALYTHPPQRTEQNFCSRCGKRTPDAITIHTCTPPQENT